jgi:Flp pilus assembly protein TadG
MKQIKLFHSNERGGTLVEFAIAATVFLTATFGVIEFGRAIWTHNALTDAARRGARYASLHSPDDADKVKNIVVYGNENGGTKPMLPNLTPDNVDVTYSEIAVNKGTVCVSINDYEFQFVVPIVGTSITMPAYSTTMTGESAGFVPGTL